MENSSQNSINQVAGVEPELKSAVSRNSNNDLLGEGDSIVLDEIQFVAFVLGDEEFGIDIVKVKEIIKVPFITRVPNTSPEIQGVINVRGEIIEVVNLCKIFKLPEKENDDNTKILEVEHTQDTTTVGFLVDSVSEVMRVSKDKLKPAPRVITDKIDDEFIKNVAVFDERLIIMLDSDKLFNF